MRKTFEVVLLGSMLCAVPALLAQRSVIEFHGTPASVTSPGMDGLARGIPASVTDPTFGRSMSLGQPAGFCCHHVHSRFPGPVYVVPYYGYSAPYVYDASMYDRPPEPQPQSAPPQVIIIKDERSPASEDSRYGEHNFESSQAKAGAAPAPVVAATPAPPVAQEELPRTTLVFRDGHKSEVRNYAIVGGNLVDLSKPSFLKKIPLASLDLEATRRENEANGVDFHLP